MYTDLMHYYKLCSELTTGTDKYYSLTEYEHMLPFERDLYLDLIIDRQNRAKAGGPVDQSDVITDFDEVPGV
jgi:hypothetical protein